MLLQTVSRLATETNLFHQKAWANKAGGTSKEGVFQKKSAMNWIEGGTGQITFEECCETVGVDPARAREKILDYCYKSRRKRISINSAMEWSLEQEEEGEAQEPSQKDW
jgi:hypothetical protein